MVEHNVLPPMAKKQAKDTGLISICEKKCISFFNKPINIKNKPCAGRWSVKDIADAIRGEKYKDVTEKHRALIEREQKATKSTRFDYIAPHGYGETRTDRAMGEISGFLVGDADSDTVPDVSGLRARLISDGNLPLVLAYISPSGKGLKFLIRIDPLLVKTDGSRKMEMPWDALNEYLKTSPHYEGIFLPDSEGYVLDPSGRDLARAAFLCYDPEAYYNPDVKGCIDSAFCAKYSPKKRKTRSEWLPMPNSAKVAEKGDIKPVLDRLAKEYLRPVDNHHDDLTSFIGACVKRGIPEDACLNYVSKCDYSQSSHAEKGDIDKLVADVYGRYPHGTLPALESNREYAIPTHIGGKDIGTVFEKTLLSVDDEVPRPPKAWVQIVNGSERILGTLGDISMLIGKAKSRKSFFINIAVSAVLSEDRICDQFEGVLPEGKQIVLYFDTEQSKYYCMRVIERIAKRVGEDIVRERLVFSSLREYPPKERLAMIENAINSRDGIGFVVIDGIRDLVSSINDEAEATMISSKLLKWSTERNVHIMCVLHQNKSDTNARGHLGTELINKCQTTLSVSKNGKDKDISIVEAEYCRDRDPEPFAFEIDEDGLPVPAENYELRTQTRNKKFDITSLSTTQKCSLLSDVFKPNGDLTYTALETQLQLSFKDMFGIPLRQADARRLIHDSLREKRILQDGNRKPYTLGNIQCEDEDVFSDLF